MIQAQNVVANKSENRILGVFLIASIFLTAFLFFIDEENFSFNWVLSAGHWIVFAIYATVIFMGQTLFLQIEFYTKTS